MPQATATKGSQITQVTTNIDPVTLRMLAGIFGISTVFAGIGAWYHRKHDIRKRQ